MKQIALKREQIFTGPLILVNKAHPIRRTIRQQELRTVGRGIRLQREAALQLKLLLENQESIVSVSGFRSHREQESLYRDSMRDKGEVFTKKYVAFPRCSEHECGLAIDLGENIEPIDEICPSFPYEGDCQNFRQKAPYFGFIQRYEQGKEYATGIAHEPWHFRYVGFPHSLIMKEKELSLEEYLEHIRREKVLKWNCGARNIEIRYIPAGSREQVWTDIPKERPYQVSGDNEGGFILTVF